MASVDTNTQAFISAQCGFDRPFTPAPLTGRMVYRFDASTGLNAPIFIDTGENSMGTPMQRKMMRAVEVHGKGTFSARVWVDGSMVVANATGVASEGPTKPRIIALPRGTKGYTIRIELCGSMDILRGFIVNYEPLPNLGTDG